MNLLPHNMQPRRNLSLPDESLMTMFRKRALTDIVEHEEGKVNSDEAANTSVPHPEGRCSKEDEEKQESQRPLLHQVVLNGNSESLKELIKNGADINVLDESGWPPLHTAIRAGKTECAALLIREGAGEFYYNKQKQDYLRRLERSQKGRKISYWR